MRYSYISSTLQWDTNGKKVYLGNTFRFLKSLNVPFLNIKYKSFLHIFDISFWLPWTTEKLLKYWYIGILSKEILQKIYLFTKVKEEIHMCRVAYVQVLKYV